MLTINDDVDGDGDGLTNEEELALGTDPFSWDTDGDGISDYDEVRVYGTDPLKRDTDADGAYDRTEIMAETDPNDPGSVLKIIGADVEPDGSVTVHWLGAGNRTYKIHRGSVAGSGNYRTLAENVAGAGAVTSFTDNTAAEGPNFYWIEVNVPPELRCLDCP